MAFTAIEAYEQGRRDMERAQECVAWFEKQFGLLSDDQKNRIRVIVIEIAIADHVRDGDLEGRL